MSDKLDGLVEASLARFLVVDPASVKAWVTARLIQNDAAMPRGSGHWPPVSGIIVGAITHRSRRSPNAYASIVDEVLAIAAPGREDSLILPEYWYQPSLSAGMGSSWP